MPNWVENYMEIKGAENTIKEVRARLESGLKDDEFLWGIVHPKDEELEDYNANIGSGGKPMLDPTGWYGWNMEHWGTKWDASEIIVEVSEDDSCVGYSFNTAWSPPINAMISLSQQYPDIEISLRFLEEQGWGGISVYKGGVETVLESWDIPETHADSIKYLTRCDCDWNEDEDKWFDDCPREESE
jgi:hypothetical protein